MLACLVMIGACSDVAADTTTAPTSTATVAGVEPTASTERLEYSPGLEATVRTPAGGPSAPLVVLIPGGSWMTADPTGLARLADRLTAEGLITVTARIRAASDGVIYPVPVQDALCALAFGVARAEEAGYEPGPAILFGHSSGAHLAALAALTAAPDLPSCPHQSVVADGLIGAAGPYDVSARSEMAAALFGVEPDEDPELWVEGNPLRLADRRPGLPVLLLHGDNDRVVPLSATTDFAAALEAHGHPTTVITVPGSDHQRIYSPEAVATPILEWVAGLSLRDQPTE
jgi:acetyl esterase/lipase